MLRVKPKLLKGRCVQLEPLNELHRKELYAAAQDERIWEHMATKGFGDQFNFWFGEALRGAHNRDQLPFVIRSLTEDKVIGSTRLYEICLKHMRLTLGYSWLIPEMWGTNINAECKLLLLKHIFEDLNMNRVEIVTDSRNLRSQAAIKKLGAKKEGVLRQHMILPDGYLRDTIMYSIISVEWPKVKTALEKRVNILTKNLSSTLGMNNRI